MKSVLSIVMLLGILFVTAGIATATTCTGNSTLQGTVVDNSTSAPIAGANLSVVRISDGFVCETARSNNFGHFYLPSGIGDDSGGYHIFVTAKGYIPSTSFWDAGYPVTFDYPLVAQ